MEPSIRNDRGRRSNDPNIGEARCDRGTASSFLRLEYRLGQNLFPSDETSPLPAVQSHRFPALLSLICLLEVVAKPTGVAAEEIAIPAVEMVHVDTADAGMVVSDAAVASRIGREKLLE